MRSLRFQLLGAACVIALAVAAAYSDSFRGTFVLDDPLAIPYNTSIYHLWPLSGPLNPPGEGRTVQGRPVVNVSFAINYAIHGARVYGYHVGNLMIHILAALTFFGILRWITKSLWIGFFGALLWGLHPLQTESVTYMVQRAESLMGLFYLLTLYAFIRSLGENANTRLWQAISICSCFLGMGSKEVMASAPLIVLLFDRSFVSGTFSKAWETRKSYYVGLAGTWILLVYLVADTGNRGSTSGFGSGVSALRYWVTQPRAILHYLSLSVWPSPLIFDYGTPWVSDRLANLPQVLVVLGLIAATVWALFKKPTWGFCGAWFFSVLAPTSIVPGNRQVLAEHRMYLALAPLFILVALAIIRMRLDRSRAFFVCCAVIACVFGGMTYARNRVYLTSVTLFQDTSDKLPSNPFNEASLGDALLGARRFREAMPHLRKAIEMLPNYSVAEDNLAAALTNVGEFEEAEKHYRHSIEVNPHIAPVHENFGFALMQEGKTDEGIKEMKLALASGYNLGVGYANLGSSLASVGRYEEAIVALRKSLEIDPSAQMTYLNLGNALVAKGDYFQGLSQMDLALKMNPNNGRAHFNRGTALVLLKRVPEAIAEFRKALETDSNNSAIHESLGDAFLESGQIAEAIEEFQIVVQKQPAVARAHYNLGKALLLQDDRGAAILEFRESLKLDPKFDVAREALNRASKSP